MFSAWSGFTVSSQLQSLGHGIQTLQANDKCLIAILLVPERGSGIEKPLPRNRESGLKAGEAIRTPDIHVGNVNVGSYF